MTVPAATAAVFLSYAREDTDAARRIADALRGFGVEVWFDQNELRGGDAWDQKIRTQIKTCALFVPMISATTQSRGEGYFRREWKLAVERTHDMAASRAFLVPIVIDATTESSAEVPEEFMRVQWTRLPGGAPTPQFVEQVKRLLAVPTAMEMGRPRPVQRAEGTVPRAKSGVPGWVWGAAVAVIAIGIFFLTRKSESPSMPLGVGQVSDLTHAKPATPAPVLAPLAPDKSIAVLPFANMSPDKDNEFFADGVHEDVITNLAKIRDLKVISRTSVLAYRDTASRNLKKIAAELGVATVLEGSVRRVGTKVRVTAQLIDARTDEHLWAETYDRDLTDVFTIQSALAQEIAAALKANFTVGERALVSTRLTQNNEAYELYLKARALAENNGLNIGAGSRALVEQIIALHEQAVAKDPAFAAAYAQLAYLHGRMNWYESLDPSPARRERAKVALDTAVRIAPDQPETKLALGAYAYYCDNDWSRALVEFHAAQAAMPNDAQIEYFIALSERRLGHFPEAVKHFNRSLDLNPRDVLCADQLGLTLFPLRRYTAAREVATRALTLAPNNTELAETAAFAQLEIDHSLENFQHAMEKMATVSNTAGAAVTAYRVALAKGDYQTALRALDEPKLKSIQTMGGLINDPVARFQAVAAFMQGDRAAAKKYAEETIRYYQTHAWTPRQEGAVKIGVAFADALAGRGEEAVKLAHEAYEWQLGHDVFASKDFLPLMAQIYFVLDRPEDVLNSAREMMRDACGLGPEYARHMYYFSQVKNDPRFEEILKLAKPL